MEYSYYFIPKKDMNDLKSLATNIAIAFGSSSEFKIPYGFFEFQVEGDRIYTNDRNGLQFQIKPIDSDYAILTIFLDGEPRENVKVELQPFYFAGKEIAKQIVLMIDQATIYKSRITYTGVFGSYVSSISTLGPDQFYLTIACKDGEGSLIEFDRQYKGDTEVGKLAYLYLTLKHSNKEQMKEPDQLNTHMAFLFSRERIDEVVSRKVYDLIVNTVSNLQFWTPFE
jgi:hypothetical protein